MHTPNVVHEALLKQSHKNTVDLRQIYRTVANIAANNIEIKITIYFFWLKNNDNNNSIYYIAKENNYNGFFLIIPLKNNIFGFKSCSSIVFFPKTTLSPNKKKLCLSLNISLIF